MITFKYSIKWDIIWLYRNGKNLSFLKSIKVDMLRFNILNFVDIIKILLKYKKIKYKIDIKVYLLSSGTTGAYTYPDKVFICPKNINIYGGLMRVLSHEIAHLEMDDRIEKLNHFEKERLVKEKEGDILKMITKI